MIRRTVTIITLLLTGFMLLQACGEGEESATENIEITASEFQEKIDKEPGVVIDVRTQEEYDEGHLAIVDGHHNFLNGDFKAQLDSLDKDETYYLYCRSGNRSGQAADLMKEDGFENVYNIGGFQDLVDAGIESKQ